MTCKHEVVVWCDICGNWLRSQSSTAAQARRWARAYGWRRSKGKDLCGGCAKELDIPVQPLHIGGRPKRKAVACATTDNHGHD
jgi:hypothetical protein